MVQSFPEPHGGDTKMVRWPPHSLEVLLKELSLLEVRGAECLGVSNVLLPLNSLGRPPSSLHALPRNLSQYVILKI